MVMAETSTGKPGAQGRDARDVHALLAFGHGAAQDHVFDLFGVEAGHALDGVANRDGGKVIGPRGMQRALEGLADWRANRTDDYGFSHKLAPAGTATTKLESGPHPP